MLTLTAVKYYYFILLLLLVCCLEAIRLKDFIIIHNKKKNKHTQSVKQLTINK